MSLNRTQIVDWLYRCGDIFTKQSDFLTGLDKDRRRRPRPQYASRLQQSGRKAAVDRR